MDSVYKNIWTKTVKCKYPILKTLLTRLREKQYFWNEASNIKPAHSNNQHNKCIGMSLSWCWWVAGLHKLWYPGIRDTSTRSKFGAHGELGDVFLFSNLGALWFSESLIRYSLHVCLREVKNNLFPSNTLIYGVSRDGSKHFNICTCEHMILGQLRMGACQAKNAPLINAFLN